MRQPQALNVGVAHRILRHQNDEQRHEQAERGRRLNERGVVAALVVRRMLGDVDRGAAVFAAEREALRHAQRDEQNRREHAERRVAGKQADRRRRSAHDQQREHEGVLASDEIADAAEHQRAERSHGEADGERRQPFQQRDGLVRLGVEHARDHRGETAKDVEVVPLDDRAG